jgi:CRP-like cAMP-binding protein
VIRCNNAVPLSQIPALQHLGDDVLVAMMRLARSYKLRAGEVLLYQGDIIQSFYVVQSGGVRLVDYNADGQCVTLKLYGQGDVFGLLAVSGSYPSLTQVEALHESCVIALDGQDVRKLMLESPALALTIVDLLTAHVHEGHERIRHMAAKRVDRRLAQSLLKLCEKFGAHEGDSVFIDLPLTQRDLAELISATVETVNRTLTMWEKQGMVRCAHKQVRVLNLKALADLAEHYMVEQANSA